MNRSIGGEKSNQTNKLVRKKNRIYICIYRLDSNCSTRVRIEYISSLVKEEIPDIINLNYN